MELFNEEKIFIFTWFSGDFALSRACREGMRGGWGAFQLV
jgi:hypothetical protein